MDVKPHNIMLDSDMNPKITDFELSIVLSDNEMTHDFIMGTMYASLHIKFFTIFFEVASLIAREVLKNGIAVPSFWYLSSYIFLVPLKTFP
jgi:serine/threonine protein kinase